MTHDVLVELANQRQDELAARTHTPRPRRTELATPPWLRRTGTRRRAS
jgi:hypothetical protein